MIDIKKPYATKEGWSVEFRGTYSHSDGRALAIALITVPSVRATFRDLTAFSLVDGQQLPGGSRQYELVELPECEINWGAMPDWSTHITRDREYLGSWRWWDHEPKWSDEDDEWQNNDRKDAGEWDGNYIPTEYHPKLRGEAMTSTTSHLIFRRPEPEVEEAPAQ